MTLKTNKIIYTLCFLLFSTKIFPIFDLSPWVVVENTTMFDFACELEAIYYPNEEDNLTLFIQKNNDFNVSFDQYEDEDENECIKVIINFICNANQAMVINPIFYEENILFNPQVKSITLTHESLQLTTFSYAEHPDHRYFSVHYNQDNGIIMNKQAISIYVKCLNNFKTTMRNIILAALEVTNWLPY